MVATNKVLAVPVWIFCSAVVLDIHQHEKHCDLSSFSFKSLCPLFSSSSLHPPLELRAPRCRLQVLSSQLSFRGAPGLQDPGRVPRQEGRGEPSQPPAVPHLQRRPESQISFFRAQVLRWEGPPVQSEAIGFFNWTILVPLWRPPRLLTKQHKTSICFLLQSICQTSAS